MGQPFQNLQRFFRELKRRNVYKVAVAYLLVAFVSLQAAQLLVPATMLPGWADDLLVYFAVAGFPITLVIAWAFEVTPEGIRRSEEPGPPSVEGGEAEGSGTASAAGGARTAARLLLGLGLVAGAVVGTWYLTGGGDRPEINDRSIAVLPFETLGQEEPSAFTDGVHGDLLTRLSRISDFRVTSRTSVMRYRKSEVPLSEIAGELGVEWILRGEVQEAGGRVRVNARLVSAQEDQQVWADSYTREMSAENLFAIQEDITREIVGELEAQLTPAERRRLEKRPTENLEAYRLYVRGRSLLDQQTETYQRQAATWFRRAIERDSTYALAWSGLADALLYLASYGYASTDSVLSSARSAVRRALTLDSSLAEAHVSRGFLHAVEGDGPVVIRELRRALELRPSYAQAQSLLGWYYPVLGRPHEGLESARRAVELDPYAPEAWANLALGFLTTGRPDSALAPARRAGELQREYSASNFYEAMALYELGRLDEAITLLRDVELAWAPSAPRTTAALARLAAGDSVPARDLVTSLPEEQETLFYRGLLHAALGEEDAAFRAFRRIEDWEESQVLAWSIVSLRHLFPRALGPLRDDQRYDRLIAEINRSWGLTPDGSLPEGVDHPS